MCLVLLFIVYYFHSFVFTSVIVLRKNDVIACVNVSFCSFFMIGRKKSSKHTEKIHETIILIIYVSVFFCLRFTCSNGFVITTIRRVSRFLGY